MNWRVGLLLILSSFVLGSVDAQVLEPGPADLQAAYEALQFDRVVQLGETILEAQQTTDRDRLLAHRLLALVGFSRQQLSFARHHLHAALSIEPTVSFELSEASPSFIEFFSSVRQDHSERSDQRGSADESTADQIVDVVDDRPAAALRSMVLPGWGQVYKGHRGRGLAYGALWTGLAAASIVTAAERSRSRTRYEEERDPLRIQSRFDEYADWQRRRNIALGATGAVWLASFVDALLTRDERREKRLIQVTPAIVGTSPGARISLAIDPRR